MELINLKHANQELQEIVRRMKHHVTRLEQSKKALGKCYHEFHLSKIDVVWTTEEAFEHDKHYAQFLLNYYLAECKTRLKFFNVFNYSESNVMITYNETINDSPSLNFIGRLKHFDGLLFQLMKLNERKEALYD